MVIRKFVLFSLCLFSEPNFCDRGCVSVYLFNHVKVCLAINVYFIEPSNYFCIVDFVYL